MRLLNTSTITLSEVNSDKTPAYAILSHRWDESEVTFQDMQDGKGIQKPGYAKIARCCAQAAEDGWQYAWIDSCCINKTSSAELSEAINSMFRWYRNSQVCYAYPSDVPSTRESPYASNSAFRRSMWFTRGWTLQELLAPETVVFFDQNWIEIGTKRSLAPLISAITGIELLFSFRKACVAQRMSWAAKRETTIVEDLAYCLMGLFDVNIPLLYGEGEKAFMRLQLEIIRTHDDESIFAWADDVGSRWWRKHTPHLPFSAHSGLIASSQTAFELSGDVHRATFDEIRPPYTMTNKGLRIEPQLIVSKMLPSIKLAGSDLINNDWPGSDNNLYLMPLNCARKGKSGHLAVYLLRDAVFPDKFTRAGPSKLIMLEGERRELLNIPFEKTMALQRSVVYVWQVHLYSTITQNSLSIMPYVFTIRFPSLLKHGISISRRFIHSGRDSTYWDDEAIDGLQLVLNLDELRYACAELWFNGSDFEAFSVKLLCSSRHAFVNLLVTDENRTSEEVGMPLVSSSAIMPYADRISKRLRSGKAISVALKNAGGVGVKKYCVYIAVDPEGYLRWPETPPCLI